MSKSVLVATLVQKKMKKKNLFAHLLLEIEKKVSIEHDTEVLHAHGTQFKSPKNNSKTNRNGI